MSSSSNKIGVLFYEIATVANGLYLFGLLFPTNCRRSHCRRLCHVPCYMRPPTKCSKLSCCYLYLTPVHFCSCAPFSISFKKIVYMLQANIYAPQFNLSQIENEKDKVGILSFILWVVTFIK